VLRFLGTTPTSSNIINTLNSIVYQIARIYNLKLPEKLLNKQSLRDYLLEQFFLINHLYPSKKLVIILDSVDQLIVSDYILKDWIIETLPPNIKMVYSTLPDHGNILSRFKEMNSLTAKNFLQIESLDIQISNLILKDLLNRSSKSISQLQLECIEEMFKKAQTNLYPLYVKLIYDIVTNWSSYHIPEIEFKLCTTIDKCIQYLFKSLEKDHGKLLFSRTIIYMTSFKNGISESEIEDILSLDDDVLYSIFEFHAPPVRRLPITLWSRIKHDLKEYMVEKEIDDTRVIYWYHRRFIEVANAFYISKMNTGERERIFSNVVDFFNETWKYKPKPYKYNEYIAKKMNLNSEQAEEIRNTSVQSTAFTENDGKVRYNKRKINELPGFIASLTSNLAMSLACEHVYFNYRFLCGMFACSSLADIIHNIQTLTQFSSYNMSEETTQAYQELKLMNLIFLQCILLMKDYPDSCVLQIVSKSLKFYGYLKYFTKLVDEYDRESLSDCSLIVAYQYSQPPSCNNLLFSLEKHSQPIRLAAIGDENDSFVITISDKLHLFNMTLLCENGEISLSNSNSNFEYSFMIVYFEDWVNDDIVLKDIAGGFILASMRDVYSYAFDASLHASLGFDDCKISNIHIISAEHVLVAFEEQSFIRVYDFRTFKLTFQRNFSKKIRFCLCNTHKKYINNIKNLKDSKVNLYFVFDAAEVQIFNVSMKEKAQISLDYLCCLASTGVDCVSAVLLKNKYASFYTFDYHYLALCMSEATIILIDLDNLLKAAVSQNAFAKLMMIKLRSKKNVTFQIVEIQSSPYFILLLVGSDGYLYYFDQENNRAACIRGSFNDAVLVDSKTLLGISNGEIQSYAIIPLKNLEYYKLAKYFSFEAHFDKITFKFLKGRLKIYFVL
jgi:hypothetical protein